MGVEPKGTGYINTWKNASDALGVKILVNTKMVEIIREKPLSGKVLGIRAMGEDGEELTFRSKCVIVATGGFAGDVNFRIKHDHRWTEEFPSSNYPNATAEGLTIVADVGGDLTGMDYIQLVPASYDLIMKKPTTRITQVTADQIYINERGERIVNSDAGRDQLRDAIYAQKDHMAFQLCDEGGRQRFKATYPHRFISDEKINACINNMTLYSGDSIQELAENSGIDPEELENTIKKYNDIVDHKHDDEFGTKPIFLKYKFEKPPFYAWRVSLMVHHTMGGVRINKKAQVMDRWGKVIPKLYAVGEVTGGIHGANRLGGNALLDIHVFGIIAGENAAKKVLGKGG